LPVSISCLWPLDPPIYHNIDSPRLIPPTTNASSYKSGVLTSPLPKMRSPLPGDLVCKILIMFLPQTLSTHMGYCWHLWGHAEKIRKRTDIDVAFHRKYSRILNSGKRVSLTKSNLTRDVNRAKDKQEHKEDYWGSFFLTWESYVFYCSPRDITKEKRNKVCYSVATGSY
jgi:hypothetical protein